jgi:hypothetical protein
MALTSAENNMSEIAVQTILWLSGIFSLKAIMMATTPNIPIAIPGEGK